MANTFANIYEYIVDANGKTIGLSLVATNIENADQVAAAWSEQTNYARIFEARNCSDNHLHLCSDGIMRPSVSAYMPPRNFR